MADSVDRAQSLFLNALEIATERDRAVYVEAECGAELCNHFVGDSLGFASVNAERSGDSGSRGGSKGTREPGQEFPGNFQGMPWGFRGDFWI